jgi:hypothetical protein
MKNKLIKQEEKKEVYKCEIYSPLPDKIIEEIYIKAFTQLEAKRKAISIATKTNILLINAQKIQIQ